MTLYLTGGIYTLLWVPKVEGLTVLSLVTATVQAVEELQKGGEWSLACASPC